MNVVRQGAQLYSGELSYKFMQAQGLTFCPFVAIKTQVPWFPKVGIICTAPELEVTTELGHTLVCSSFYFCEFLFSCDF